MGGTSFFSTCPACKHARLQNGYTRTELTASLSAGQTVDAYCLICDIVWPISARERFLITTRLASEQPAPSQVPSRPSAFCWKESS
jgi:hypothetical protein